MRGGRISTPRILMTKTKFEPRIIVLVELLGVRGESWKRDFASLVLKRGGFWVSRVGESFHELGGGARLTHLGKLGVWRNIQKITKNARRAKKGAQKVLWKKRPQK